MTVRRKIAVWLFIGTAIVAASLFFCVSALKEFGAATEETHRYEPYEVPSYDGKYTLQTLKIEDETGVGARFIIKSNDQGEIVYECPDGYRLFDLFYMNWVAGTYDVYVDSHDIGACIYKYHGGEWTKEASTMNLYKMDVYTGTKS